MKKVVLISNPYRDKGLKTALRAQKILNEVGIESAICLTHPVKTGHTIPQEIIHQNIDELLQDADMLISFGGDGTILHAAKSANAHGVPLLGVNLGSIGFLAELEQDELGQLARLATGDYFLEERMMMDVWISRNGKISYQDTALNDILIIKAAAASVIELSIRGDEVLMSQFLGDGVILSTPTGSTAYSMSAGGPVVEPTAENIIMTPVCAHGIHARAFVLAPSRVVTVQLKKPTRKTALISVDGSKTVRITDKDLVVATRSQEKTRLVRLADRKFYDIFRLKFGRERKGYK
ncbi:MAG: NAD(+)/NADH kinase [Oscillospiraceae bacterium]|nr:NAD(+)/NADH kinase [Oscillospiraceae bacterium]